MFNKVLPYIAAIVIFLTLNITYFLPQFNGQVINSGDLSKWRGMRQEIKQHKAATGEDALWTNAMFGGMPTYQIDVVRKGNGLATVEKILRLGIAPPTGRFFLAMLSFFAMLVVLRVNPWLAIVGAVAFAFSTNNLVLYEAGHMTKVSTIFFLPLVIAGMILAFRKQYLLGGAVFALGTGLDLWASHPQMTYYFVITTAIFGVAQIVKAAQAKDFPHFFKAAGALVVGGLLALGSSASNILPTLEYAEDTMRGAPILEAEGAVDPNNSSQTEGLAWNYAMAWSNSTIDLFSSFIPGVAGGGSGEPISRDSEIGRDLSRRGAQLPETFPAPLYWGDLTFTSGPIYFGAVVFLLFLMGLTLVEGPVKWWLALGTLLTLLLSMGKNLEFFNRIFFEYVPLYNKFRTPNSVLSVAAVLIPALGFLAANRIVKGEVSKQEIIRSLMISGGILAAICLFFILLGSSFFDFSHRNDAASAQTFQPDLLIAARQSLMQSDAFRSLALIVLSGAGIWAFANNKLEKKWLILALGALTLFDLWGVAKRYVNDDTFTSAAQAKASFAPRPVDTQILQDKDPHYRVLDVSVRSPFESTTASYYHKSLGGYHAAKLQRFEDIKNRHLMQGNQGVLDMLNTKYVIQGGPEGQAAAQVNPGALGNAWFIDTIQMVQNANQEIAALTTLDPGREVVVHQEFSDYISGLDPNQSGSISLSSYAPNKLTYQSNTSSEQLAVFSEVWYGPDKGWNAYIDDEPVEHIRVNYLLRALRVPAGQHTVRFEFEPSTYKAGVTISLISSLIIIFGVLGIAGYSGLQFWQKMKNEPAVSTASKAPVRKKVKATKSRTKKKPKK